MKEMNSQTSKSEIERYLYGEMSDAERTTFEENFFGDDEFFYSVVDSENELIDRYASGRIDGAERRRFERALENAPERRAKTANARALQTFIAEEKPQAKTAAADVSVKQTFGQRLAQMFSLQTPAFAYAMAGMLFIFALSSIFLLLDNRRKSDELARLQNERQGGFQQAEKDLQTQLGAAQTRGGDLENQIDDERETSGDLTDELQREKQRRERIETELERLRKENSARPTPTPREESAPVIASIFLSPMTTRGGGTVKQNFAVERATKRIAVRLALPDETKTGERFSVRLNDKIIARNVAARAGADGQKTLQFAVSLSALIDGSNRLSALDANGREITAYDFFMRKN